MPDELIGQSIIDIDSYDLLESRIVNTLGAGSGKGATGPEGPIGPIGPIGITGPVGPIGPIGPQGIQGVIGTVNELVDVNIDSPGPVSGDVLTYDANSPGGWIAAPLPLDIDHDAITLQGGSPSLDYLTLNNQEISLGLINLATDVTGILDAASVSNNSDVILNTDARHGEVTLVNENSPGFVSLSGQELTVGLVDLATDVIWTTVPNAYVSSSSVIQHETDINHDALLNVNADEHIDWTTDQTIGSPDKKIHSSNIDFPDDIDHDEVTLEPGSPALDYLTIAEQVITLNEIDLATDVTGILDASNIGTHSHDASDITDFDIEVSNNTDVAANTTARHAATTLTTTASPLDYLTLDEGTQAFTLNQVDLGADVTGLLPIADVSVGGTPDGTKFLRDDGTWATPVDIDHDEVTLITTSSPSFVSLSDQELTVGLVDLATDVTGLLPVDELGAGSNGQVLTVTAGTPTWETPAAGHDAVTLDGGSPALDYLTIDNQEINLNLIDLVTDVTGTLSVDNGGTGATTVLGAQQSLDLEPGVDVQAHSTILDNTTASFTTADETKVDYLTVTAATDLDEIRNRVIELDQAVILQGTWDPNSASPASFPQGVSSPVAAGYTWIITSDATVDGVSFHTDDKVIALVDSPDPTSADDWHVSEYHDDVISVAGLDGIISAADLRTAINVADGAEVNVNADWNSVSGDSQILNKPTLGTAAAADTGDFATSTQGTTADSALQPGDITLTTTSSPLDYLTLSGETFTLNQVNLAIDVIGTTDDITEGVNKFVTAGDITNLGNLSGTNTGDVTLVTTVSPSFISLSDQELIVGLVDLSTDVEGQLPIADVSVGGTPDGTKFLRDDGTWAGIPGGISTLDGLDDVEASVPTDGQVLTYDASSPSGWVATDPGHIVEVNDLSASVTWGSIEVPNANITSSSVTQHEGTINHDALLNYVSDEHIDWSVDQTIGSPDKKIHSSNIDFPDDIDHDSVTLVTTVSPSFISLSDQELTVGLVDPLVDIDITGTPDGTKFLKDDGSWATPVDIDHDEVTLEPGSPALDYLTIVGQVITLNEIDLATDVTGILDPSNLPGDLGATTLNELTDVNATATDGQVLTYSESSPSGWIASDTAEVHDAVTLTSTQSPALSYITLSGSPSEQELVLDLIDLNIDVTGLLSLTNVNISGTPDGTKFLRDDGTWAGIPGGISTLDGLDDVDAGVPSDGHVLTYSSSSPTGWVATDPGHIVEVNDLSSVVTWADVPDANITSSSVTQHEALINHDALLNYVADEHIDWTADQTIGSPDKKIHSSNIDFPADIDHDAVTLVTTVSPSFITLSDQELTVDQVDLTTDVTGLLPIAEVSIGGSVTGSNFLGDDGTWQSIPEAGASALSELTDVDFGSPGPADGQVLTYDASSPSGWVATDPGHIVEVNDLNASVTWADVPDANITSSSVIQHSTALEGVLNHDNLVGFNADEHIDWTADQTIGSPDKKIHSSNIDFPADIDHDEVTLNGGSPLLDYLTLSGQEITLNQVDLSTDVTGILDPSNLPGDLGASTLDELTDVDFGSPGPLDGQVLTYSSSSPTGWISQSLPENGVKDVIVQTNTFEVGDAVYDNAGTWELADASSGNTAETLGLVGDATSTEFTLVTHGRIEGIARSPALIPNQMYFLSDTNPGELTDEEPITNGSISKPMLWTDSSTSGYILNYRGIIVNIVDAPTDTLSSLNDVDFGSPGPTNGQVLTYSDSSPSGWVAADPGALSEINDLSSSVTWVNVPDANITSSSVTQHEALINHDSLLNFEPNEHIDWTVDQSAVSPVVSIHPSNLPEDIDHDEVTLNGGSPLLDYLTLSGQEITLNQVDLSTDVTGLLPIAEVSIGGSVTGSNFLGDDGTWQSIPEAGASALSELTDVDFGSPGPADGQVLTYSDSSPSGWVAAPLLTYGTVQGTGVNTYNIRAADSDGEGYGIGDARGEYSVDLQTHRYEPSRVASGFYCTIGGGADNTASVYASTVSGGYRNKAINIHSTVSGGNDNVASGDSSTVSGGQKNEATGDHSTVSGGWLNTASGDYSWAGGKFAKTGANNNTFAWSDGYGSIDLAAIPIPNAANQFAIKAAGGLRLLDGNEGTAGYVLTADAAGVGTWQAVTLSELTDVDFGSPGPVDGQVLTYSDSSPSGWVAADSTGSGSGDSLTEDVTQVGHSFTIGDPVYYASSAWVASDAGAENTAEVLGIVTSVAGNDFTVTLGGRITGLSGLTADSIYYLGVGGGMDLTEPSTVDQVSKPIFYSTSTTDGIFLQMRGSTVTDGSVQVDFGISGGAETDVLAANTKVATLHITRDMTLEEVLVSVNTSVSSQIATFDIQLNDNSSPAGTSIFSTQPQIDVNDTFSLTSVTPAVLATTSLSRGDELSFWSDQADGGNATGLKFYLAANIDTNLRTLDYTIGVTDETSDITPSVTDPISTFYAPRDFILQEIIVGVTDTPGTQNIICDVKINGDPDGSPDGESIFSTLPEIIPTENTSFEAGGTDGVLSTTQITKGDRLDLYCTQAGTAPTGSGLKFYINATY